MLREQKDLEFEFKFMDTDLEVPRSKSYSLDNIPDGIKFVGAKWYNLSAKSVLTFGMAAIGSKVLLAVGRTAALVRKGKDYEKEVGTHRVS